MWTVVITVKDAKGAKSTIQVSFPGATLLGAIITFMQNFLPLLDVIIGGQILSYSANFNVSDLGTYGLKGAPAANTDVEEGALFVWTSENGFLSRNRYPTFLETKILAGTRQVNVADTDVAAVINDMVAGVGGTAPSDGRGDDITALSSAKEMFQKSRRV